MANLVAVSWIGDTSGAHHRAYVRAIIADFRLTHIATLRSIWVSGAQSRPSAAEVVRTPSQPLSAATVD